MLNEVRIYRKNQKYLFLGQGQNELPRRKQRGINLLNLHSFRGKPRGIEPEEIELRACVVRIYRKNREKLGRRKESTWSR